MHFFKAVFNSKIDNIIIKLSIVNYHIIYTQIKVSFNIHINDYSITFAYLFQYEYP